MKINLAGWPYIMIPTHDMILLCASVQYGQVSGMLFVSREYSECRKNILVALLNLLSFFLLL